jgi:cytochrome c oxidase cbb3-type subunit I/II
MQRYPWLLSLALDTAPLKARIGALRKVGVPYPAGYEDKAGEELKAQAAKVVTNLKVGLVTAEPDREIIALIAYLQRLGTDIKSTAATAPATPAPAAK